MNQPTSQPNSQPNSQATVSFTDQDRKRITAAGLFTLLVALLLSVQVVSADRAEAAPPVPLEPPVIVMPPITIPPTVPPTLPPEIGIPPIDPCLIHDCDDDLPIANPEPADPPCRPSSGQCEPMPDPCEQEGAPEERCPQPTDPGDPGDRPTDPQDPEEPGRPDKPSVDSGTEVDPAIPGQPTFTG